MITKLHFVGLLFLCLICFEYNGQETFQKLFGPTFRPKQVLQLGESGFVIVGNTSQSLGLMRLDQDGNLIWTKSYSTQTSGDEGTSVVQTADSGFIAVGGSYGPADNNLVTLIVKTDQNGEIQWQKAINSGTPGEKYSIHRTQDGNYVIAGSSTLTNVFCVKIDEQGELIFGKKLSQFGNYDMYTRGVIHTPSGILIGGYTNSSILNDTLQSFLLKLDLSGNFSWAKTYNDLAFLDLSSSGTEIMAFGQAQDNTPSMSKLDAEGEVIWTKTYTSSQPIAFHAVTKVSDTKYLVAGGYDSLGYYDSRRFMRLEIDSSGQILASAAYGVTRGNTILNSIAVTPDGANVLVGEENNSLLWDSHGSLYIVKTDPNGYSGCHESSVSIHSLEQGTLASPFSLNTVDISLSSLNLAVSDVDLIEYDACQLTSLTKKTPLENISISPNPFHEKTLFSWSHKVEKASFELTNALGKQIKTSSLSNTDSFSLDRNDLPAGIYFWKIFNGDTLHGSGKIVVE